MKVFPDTNVWLSATLFSGLCAELVIECGERDWLLTSPLIQAEAHAVLRRKFPHRPDASDWFDAVWSAARCVDDANDPVDDNDVRLVATAASHGANLFVTGDKRVLNWARSGALQIVNPRQAWVMLFAPHLPH